MFNDSAIFQALVQAIEGIQYPVPREDMWVEEWVIPNSSSTVRKANDEEVDKSLKVHISGGCDGSIIFDTASYMYDIRHCAICGNVLSCI